MPVTHPQIQKHQPWKKLLSSDTADPGLSDICTMTDKPWARLQLAEECETAVLGPRQHRHPAFEQYRRPDPFPKIYKAEACRQESPIKGEDRATVDFDEDELDQKLRQVEVGRAVSPTLAR
ncbi:hypothetical protein PG987_015449 [Apiospora arundinis]